MNSNFFSSLSIFNSSILKHFTNSTTKLTMIKKTIALGLFLMSLSVYSQIPTTTPIPITKVYSDFGGYWISGSAAVPNPIKPNDSHNLLAFTWNGTTYSTGINNALLTTNNVTFNSQQYQAFPTFFTSAATSSTYIGVGLNYGGSGNVDPVPVENNLGKYLTDGVKGLDLGTGIFNFPISLQITYDITSITPTSIADGIPDVVITQIGDVSTVLDEYYFTDANNNIIGTKYIVDFGKVADIGNADWKFYTVANPPKYVAGFATNPTRKLRLLAFDWSELGINATNISQITKLVKKFSGQSDAAFIAFNKNSIAVKATVSGTIFNDNDAAVPNGNPYSGATVILKDASQNTVATKTTTSNGSYFFNSINTGQYTIEITAPNGFSVVGNTAGNANNNLSITVGNDLVTDQNFGINQPPVANDNTVVGSKNTPVSVNLAANDVDPNNGNVVPSTINLIVPVGATNIVTTTDSLTKGFTITGQGTWLVDATGVLAFTPDNGFTGNATNIKYKIRDTANLLSNEATVFIKIGNLCYPPAATIGTTLHTNHGITSLGRAGAQNPDNWPMVRKGAWTVLESKTKGFVVNRMTTAQVNAIATANLVEGMLVYDVTVDCLKIYTSTDGGTTFGWKCLNQQVCLD